MSPFIDMNRPWPQPKTDAAAGAEGGGQQKAKAVPLEAEAISRLAPGDLLQRIGAAGISPDIQIDFHPDRSGLIDLVDVLDKLQEAGINPEVHINFQFGEKGGN